MRTQTKLTHIKLTRLLVVLLILFSLTLAACNTAANNSGIEPAAGQETENIEDSGDREHDDDMHQEHEDDAEHEHDDSHEHEETERIDNAGAVIRIVSPAGGSTFGGDEDVIVEVEVEGFTLGEDGNHWHIYVDGASWGMVMGQATAQVLRGIDPGEHELAVYLANGDHIELAAGDAITITVTE